MLRRIPAASLGLYLLAALPVGAEDIFGPGNDLSNVQGGVTQAPRGAPPPLAMVQSPENRSLCDRHFSGMESADRRKIEELGQSNLTSPERSARYRAYIDERDAFSKRCGATFTGIYDARIQQTSAQGRHNFPIEAFPLRPAPEDKSCELPCYNPAGGRPPFRGTPEPADPPPPPPPPSTTIIIINPPSANSGPIGSPAVNGTGAGTGASEPNGPAAGSAQQTTAIRQPDPPPLPPDHVRFANHTRELCEKWQGTYIITDHGNVYCDVPKGSIIEPDGSGVTVDDMTRGAVPLQRLLER